MNNFEATRAQLAALDPHFATLWARYVTTIEGRDGMDRRTALLTRIGQYTCLRHEHGLADAIREAMAAGVPVAQILDVILQCTVVAGDSVLHPALDIFEAALDEAGLRPELVAAALPVTGTDETRSLERETKTWDQADVDDPRRDELIERYGWLGISTGLRIRPHHMFDILQYLDSLDPEFARVWLEYCYHGLYSRGVLDDRTRLICQAADCIAAGHLNQARAHMSSAMRFGTHPRELLEMVFQGMVHLGMPTTFAALKVLIAVLTEDRRLDDIGKPIASDQLQRTVG